MSCPLEAPGADLFLLQKASPGFFLPQSFRSLQETSPLVPQGVPMPKTCSYHRKTLGLETANIFNCLLAAIL